MAKRTGTQLKSDMASVDTALNTAITTPSQANVDAVLTAARSLYTNALDSKDVATSNTAQPLSKDVYSQARLFIRELTHVQTKASGAELSARLRKFRATLATGPWAQLKDRGTTT